MKIIANSFVLEALKASFRIYKYIKYRIENKTIANSFVLEAL